MCNWEGLILNPYWLCFCDFNSHFAAFVIIGMLNDLPQGALPAPRARMPLFDSLGDGLTLPTYEGLWLSWVLCVGNGAPHLLLTRVAQKSTFEELELQIAVASLFVDIIADIPFHTTSEMTIRKWNSHIPLLEACRSRRHLQELNGLFLLCVLTCPHLWSIEEPGIQAPTRWLFQAISLPSFGSKGSPKLYSLPQDLNTWIY